MTLYPIIISIIRAVPSMNGLLTTATAEITNTPNSAIARIIATLIVVTRFVTKGSIKGYTSNRLRLKKRTHLKVVSLAYFKMV